MAIDTQIYRIKNSVKQAYSAVQTMDGELPEVQNVDNLADAIKTIPKSSGGTSFTTDETLTMSDDNVLSVTTPVKGVTKTEFDTMSDADKKGLVVVTDEQSSGGAGGSSGPITWTDIFGRPDLTNVGSMRACLVTLKADSWVNNAQTIVAEGVSSDEDSQLIVPVPKNESKGVYESSGVICESQNDDALTFKCTTTPTVDLKVNAFVFGAGEIGYEGEFVWWCPAMTSDNEPSPYKAYASSYQVSTNNVNAPFNAFDSSVDTIWISANDTTGRDSEQWLMFDAGEKMIVNGVRISLGQFTSIDVNFPLQFTIVGSNDNVNWKTIYEQTLTSVNLGDVYTCLFDTPKTYRYWRMNCGKNSNDNYRVGVPMFEFSKLVKPEEVTE